MKQKEKNKTDTRLSAVYMVRKQGKRKGSEKKRKRGGMWHWTSNLGNDQELWHDRN